MSEHSDRREHLRGGGDTDAEGVSTQRRTDRDSRSKEALDAGPSLASLLRNPDAPLVEVEKNEQLDLEQEVGWHS